MDNLDYYEVLSFGSRLTSVLAAMTTNFCIICLESPREILLQCGHLFSCAVCIQSLSKCALCREPITASYNIQGLSDSSGGGYISSGSETYAEGLDDVCFICNAKACFRFRCPDCPSEDPIELCERCKCGFICLFCKRPSQNTDFSLRSDSPQSSVSSFSSDSAALPSEPLDVDTLPTQETLDSSTLREIPSTTRDSGIEKLVETCLRANSLLEFDEAPAFNRRQLALEVCRRYIELVENSKAVILAPTVSMFRELVDNASTFGFLKCCPVLGNAEVDAWKQEEWNETVSNHDVLITQPQLFLETLDNKFLKLSEFCVIVFEECQHCSRHHPYAKIVARHCQYLQSNEIRIVGLSNCLVKRKKASTPADRQKALKQLKMLLCCKCVKSLKQSCK